MSERPASERPVLSIAEAAELLGVGQTTIRDLLNRGALPEVPRIGKRRLIPRAAIDRLIQQAMDSWSAA